MKKIVLILCGCFLLTGCTDKVTNVVNAQGDSKTYQFFINEDYSQAEYTLKLKNENRDITIIHSNNKEYYQVKDKNETSTTIEKDGKRYTLNNSNKTYTVENIVSNTNYALGYLPADMEQLKTQKYKTGKERNQRAESCFWETKTAKTCKGKGCKRKTAERIQRAKRETSQRKDD